jgi:hypothetical protein
MATDGDQPNASEAEESNSDELSFQEEIEIKRQMDVIEREAESLSRFQKFVRIKSDQDPDATEEFHDRMVTFIGQQLEETDELGITEISAALWNELLRIEQKAQKSSEEQPSKNTQVDSQEASQPAPDGVESTSASTELTHDPAFQ